MIPCHLAEEYIHQEGYIVVRPRSPRVFGVKMDTRKWKKVSTIELAKKQLDIWPTAKVYKLGAQVEVEANVYHLTTCTYRYTDGKKPCSCIEFEYSEPVIL